MFIRHHHGITGPHKGRTEGILYFSRLFVWRDQQSKRCQASSRSCPSGAAGAWREGTEHSKWSNQHQDWCFGCCNSSWKIKIVHHNTLTLQKMKYIRFQMQNICMYVCMYVSMYVCMYVYIYIFIIVLFYPRFMLHSHLSAILWGSWCCRGCNLVGGWLRWMCSCYGVVCRKTGL